VEVLMTRPRYVLTRARNLNTTRKILEDLYSNFPNVQGNHSYLNYFINNLNLIKDLKVLKTSNQNNILGYSFIDSFLNIKHVYLLSNLENSNKFFLKL
jgi:hypothetical protein